MALDPANLAPGMEQHEEYTPSSMRRTGEVFVQYDYRALDGELFSTVKPDLETCRSARDAWLAKRTA